VFYCHSVTKVVSNLGILTLCLDSKEFGVESEGFVISNPAFYFQAIKKSKPCQLRASLLLYSFDLCLKPLQRPIKIHYKNGNKVEEVELLP
jgi:hypothetical protein